MKPANDRRRALLARVHILVKELGLADADYREWLHDEYGVRSAGVLNDAELASAADDLTKMLPDKSGQKRPYPGRPRNIQPGPQEASRSAQLRKIEALLAEAGYPWSYADALARRICKADKIDWVPEHDLYKVITALELDAKRHGRDRR